MDPAKPPFPSPWNLPFQPEVGIQTSNSICESLDGWITPCTRQKAGSFLKDGKLAGKVKAPAATVAAEVMVVSASFKPARLSQVAAASGAARRARQGRARRVIMGPWEGGYHVEFLSVCIRVHLWPIVFNKKGRVRGPAFHTGGG